MIIHEPYERTKPGMKRRGPDWLFTVCAIGLAYYVAWLGLTAWLRWG